MAEKKQTLNIDELTPFEKLLGKKILDIQALVENNRTELDQIIGHQKAVIANQNAEIEILKEQNALLKEQVLRLTQIQETTYELLMNYDVRMTRRLQGKHRRELEDKNTQSK